MQEQVLVVLLIIGDPLLVKWSGWQRKHGLATRAGCVSGSLWLGVCEKKILLINPIRKLSTVTIINPQDFSLSLHTHESNENHI